MTYVSLDELNALYYGDDEETVSSGNYDMNRREADRRDSDRFHVTGATSLNPRLLQVISEKINSYSYSYSYERC